MVTASISAPEAGMDLKSSNSVNQGFHATLAVSLVLKYSSMLTLALSRCSSLSVRDAPTQKTLTTAHCSL